MGATSILERFPNLADVITNVFGGHVEVTVTYEALLEAAEDVLTKVRALEERRDEVREVMNRLMNNWTGEACENIIERLRALLEKLEDLIRKFRQHAENLKMIAQNYTAAAGDISSKVSGLSSDVIV